MATMTPSNSDQYYALMPRAGECAKFNALYSVFTYWKLDKVCYTFRPGARSVSAPVINGGSNTQSLVSLGRMGYLLAGPKLSPAYLPQGTALGLPASISTWSSFLDYSPRLRPMYGKPLTITVRPKLLRYAVTNIGAGVITGDMYTYTYAPFPRMPVLASDNGVNPTSCLGYGALFVLQGIGGSVYSVANDLISTYYFTLWNPV